jgi:hypothetical protein
MSPQSFASPPVCVRIQDTSLQDSKLSGANVSSAVARPPSYYNWSREIKQYEDLLESVDWLEMQNIMIHKPTFYFLFKEGKYRKREMLHKLRGPPNPREAEVGYSRVRHFRLLWNP